MVAALNHQGLRARPGGHHLAPVEQFVACCGDQKRALGPTDPWHFEAAQLRKMLGDKLEGLIAVKQRAPAQVAGERLRRPYRRVQQHSAGAARFGEMARIEAAQRTAHHHIALAWGNAFDDERDGRGGRGR